MLRAWNFSLIARRRSALIEAPALVRGALRVKVQPLSLGADDEDQLDGAVDGAEPVRRPSRELDGLTGLDDEGLLAQKQPQAAAEHVEPVLSFVNGKLVGRPPVPGVDVNLVGVKAGRGAAMGERPQGHAVALARQAADAGVVRWRRCEQLVCAHPERRGQSGDVVEGEPALARLQPAERREVDAGPLGDLLQRQPPFGAKLAQPPADPRVDWLLMSRPCRYGKSS
jgi:hypothetical protein